MKTALVLIATGPKYQQYIGPLLDSAEKFFVPHSTVLWTDSCILWNYDYPGMSRQFMHDDEGYPRTTLHRYRTILKQTEYLRQFDHIFYCDIDMRFVALVGKEIFSDRITATEHPGYVGLLGPTEQRVESTAFMRPKTPYFCGGFVGGPAIWFLHMAETIANNIDRDEANGITAVWHDESHLNRYLHDILPAKVLSPEYCYPDVKNDHYRDIWRAAGRPEYTPIILALEKGRR